MRRDRDAGAAMHCSDNPAEMNPADRRLAGELMAAFVCMKDGEHWCKW